MVHSYSHLPIEEAAGPAGLTLQNNLKKKKRIGGNKVLSAGSMIDGKSIGKRTHIAFSLGYKWKPFFFPESDSILNDLQ